MIGLAVLVPSLLVLVFGTINVAWWYHGRNVALAAAREGTAQGRVQGAGATVAASTASGFAASTGRGILSAVAVSTAGSSATQVCVQVQARVPLFVPFLPTPAVTQHDCAPVEVFTP